MKYVYYCSVLYLALLLSCLAFSAPIITVHNHGTVGTVNFVTLTVYNDSNLKTQANLTGLNNETFDPSSIYENYSYRYVYGMLTSSEPENVSLNVYTENWNPPDAANYVYLFVFRNLTSPDVEYLNGTTIQAPAIMQIELTLYTLANLPSTDYPFSFDVSFQASPS